MSNEKEILNSEIEWVTSNFMGLLKEFEFFL